MLQLVSRFGDNVKALRERAGLTQADLADRLDVKQPAVWKWEKESGLPSTPTLFRLANALGCSLEDLLQGVNEEYTQRARDREQEWIRFMRRWSKGETTSDEIEAHNETALRMFKSAKRAEILSRVFEPVDDSDAEALDEVTRILDADEAELVDMWRRITPEAKDAIHALLVDLQPSRAAASKRHKTRGTRRRA
jgi:transcriptional regulator with XRE-family HTH domain